MHRVYVVDDIGHALAIITNTDVLRKLMEWEGDSSTVPAGTTTGTRGQILG